MLVTVDEAAAILRISRSTVYRLIAQRRLPFFRIGSGIRFRQDDLSAYLRSARTGAMRPTLCL